MLPASMNLIWEICYLYINISSNNTETDTTEMYTKTSIWYLADYYCGSQNSKKK